MNFYIKCKWVYCYNSWFNCFEGFNNMFQIVMCNMNDEITSIYNYDLQDGNTNLNDIKPT